METIAASLRRCLNIKGIQDHFTMNSVQPGAVVQFVPVGYDSDGSLQTLWNSNFLGSNGTWTSSNPLVMLVTPNGQTAISQGTSIIRYTLPDGVAFSEWIMTVQPGGE
jgi:hypothetical protein